MHLRSFLPYVVPRLRKNEIRRQPYIQHNYVIYYYICVDVDSRNLSLAEQRRNATLDDDYYYYCYADVPTPPTPTLLTADATRESFVP
jgi:hypothetical protein